MNAYIGIFIIVMQIIMTLLHVVVYKAVAIFTPHGQLFKTFYFVLFVLLSALFTVANLLVNKIPSSISDIVYVVSAVWLGTFFWLLVGSLFLFTLNIAFYPSAWFKVLGACVFVGMIGVSVYGMYNAQKITTTNYSVQIKDLPKSWEGKKAVFFADSHFGSIQKEQYARKLVTAINNENPELVFMAGDFFDGPKIDFDRIGTIFSNVDAKNGKYFVTGNHEEYAGMKETKEAIKKGDFVILDETSSIVDGVQIIGVPYTRHNILRTDVEDVLSKANFDSTKPSIVLKHIPLQLNLLEEKGVSLVLSGHTHRGQIWPFSKVTALMYKGYDYGLHSLGKSQVLTTSGAGTWGPPQRIGSNNEIVVITFIGENN